MRDDRLAWLPIAMSIAALLTACVQVPVLDCEMSEHAIYDRSSEARGATTSEEALAQIVDDRTAWKPWRPDAPSEDRVTHWIAVSPAQTIVSIATTELTDAGWFVTSTESCA
jgi:hypothetical protein